MNRHKTSYRSVTIVAGTGHRPEKLIIGAYNGYDSEVARRIVDLAVCAIGRYHPEIIITGMAQGWDQAIAEAAFVMAVPYHAYVPFQGQERRWPKSAQRKYQSLLSDAEQVRVINDGVVENHAQAAQLMQQRNEAMMDALGEDDSVWALWNGDTFGGTYNCVKYAQRREINIVNFWTSWERYKDE